jgi:hypothetical protein
VSEAGTGIGASELVDVADVALDALDLSGVPEAAVLADPVPASLDGCGTLPSAPGAAAAELGSAPAAEQATTHQRTARARGITRA